MIYSRELEDWYRAQFWTRGHLHMPALILPVWVDTISFALLARATSGAAAVALTGEL